MNGLFKQRTILTPVTNNMTGTATLHSHPMDWQTIRGGAIQAVWTGTPTGTFTVEGSLNYLPNPDGSPGTGTNAGVWTSLGASVSNPAGSAGNSIVDISLTGVPWVRLTYVNVSGTGTLTVYGAGKGI